MMMIMVIVLHTVICDHYGRLDYKHFGSSYGLAATGQHLIYIMWRHIAAQSATRFGTTARVGAVSVHGYWIFHNAWG